jgi:hypothetical protein
MTLWLTGSLAQGSVHSPNVLNTYPPYTEIVVQAVQGVSHKLGYRESQAKDAVSTDDPPSDQVAAWVEKYQQLFTQRWA